MDKTRLGRTALMVSRSGFGAIPIQRISVDEAVALLCKAIDAGINLFDTAYSYSDSEEKIGRALGSRRGEVFIATKSPAKDGATLAEHLEESLARLKTDYIDLYQLHNPKTLPKPGDEDGLYEALMDARRRGLVRFIGLSNHRRSVALEAIESGLYDTIQFPLSSLSSELDLGLLAAARDRDVGFIAMKALAGGLLTNARSAFAYMRSLGYAVPIWGIEKEWQLDEFLALERNPPEMDEETRADIERDRAELASSFCRACGYCLPCSVGIEINTAARVTLLMRRMRSEPYTSPDFRAKMERIELCTDCGLCRERCPYELDPPAMLRAQLARYREIMNGERAR
jgi:predicted aldo/keto reductase-like oxidoreductase